MKIGYYILLAILISSCSSAKYTSYYKNEKKLNEAITLLTPLVIIHEKDNDTITQNRALEASHKNMISNVSNNLLDSKYKTYQQAVIYKDTKEILELCDNLEQAEKSLEGFIFPKSSIIKTSKRNTKYAILIIYEGIYNPKYEPHYNFNKGMATNSIIIAPWTKPLSDIRLLVVNLENNEIVHYDSKASKDFDPRLSEEVEKLTRSILKTVYYK